MRGYKDQRLQNQHWRARSCSSKAHQSRLSSGPSHIIFHHVLSFGQMFTHSSRPETPTTLMLSIAIRSWQHFSFPIYLVSLLPPQFFFFLYFTVDNFWYVASASGTLGVPLCARWTKIKINIRQRFFLVSLGYLLKTFTFVLAAVWQPLLAPKAEISQVKPK